MRLICFFLFYGSLLTIESTCPIPIKFYVDCSINRTIDSSVQFCKTRHMVLLQLNDSSLISDDIILLNDTMRSLNCNGNFWFLSHNNTAFLGNTKNLHSGLFGSSTIISIILCWFGNCPTTTTTSAPTIYAMTVCTRAVQNNIRQKCLMQTQSNIRTFSYKMNNIYTGILNIVSVQSQIECYGICSSDDVCVGATFDRGICTLYL